MTTFDDVCGILAAALTGSVRQAIVDEAAAAETLGAALLNLRKGMRANVWRAAGQTIDIERTIQRYDRRTRQLGFHVLNDWDGIADRVNEDTIPVDVLHYLVERRGSEPVSRQVLAILLDYHFMHLLALVSLHVWDEGDPDANLDTVGELLRQLQGPAGSGQQFAADAETLILIATSHYELHERGYAVLLDRTRELNDAHRLKIALGHASSMGSHLRFGFEATYGRDTVNMRDDNVADYPWLCFALATLMTEYGRMTAAGERGDARDHLVEAMLNGLTADARAFIGAPPGSLSSCEVERGGFRDAFHAGKRELIAEFEALRPVDQFYSPLGFFFNFSHNVLKGVVIDALLTATPCELSFNDLLTGIPRQDPISARKTEVAQVLMGYARANPHRIRGRLRPVIVYDVQTGREAYSVALRKLNE